jgi:hypothetical protein
MKRGSRAVMHCTAKEHARLIDRGTLVVAGLNANSTIYPDPNPKPDELSLEVGLLVTLSGQAKVNTQKKEARDQQASKLFGMLLEETHYVNKVAKGDRATILLSGFEASAEPSPRPVPDVPVIKRVENGSAPHSAKIFLAKTTSVLNTKKESLNYIVQMCTDDSKEENWKTVLHTQNSKKLLVLNLVRGQEYFFRISALNARGQSDWSETVAFIAQ